MVINIKRLSSITGSVISKWIIIIIMIFTSPIKYADWSAYPPQPLVNPGFTGIVPGGGTRSGGIPQQSGVPNSGYNYPSAPGRTGLPLSQPGVVDTNKYRYEKPKYTQIPPKFEFDITNVNPYLQENVILTLRIITTTLGDNVNNVKEIDPILPQTQAVTFQALLEPTAYARPAGLQLQMVNEMRYMLTPLLVGDTDIALAVNITVTAENGSKESKLTLNAAQPLHLKVRPQVPGVTPWLPLEQLAISSNLKEAPQVEPGVPLTLVFKVKAAGSLANQLPSLENLLQAQDFRIYRGKTEFESGPSQDGRHIMGIRTENYTLVPQYRGILRLPSLRLAWFNVHTDLVEYANLPIKLLDTSGNGNRSNRPSEYNSYWLPLLGPLMVFMLLFGYWIGVNYSGVLEQYFPVAAFRSNAGIKLARGANLRFNFRSLYGKLKITDNIAGLLPLPIKFWLWVKSANTEQIPSAWLQHLQVLSWRSLTIGPYTPNIELAKRIVKLQLSTNLERLNRLFGVLDSNLYGNQVIDFTRWKSEFERQIRPSIKSIWGRSTAVQSASKKQLPPLNPELV
ncbi:hypothetical protein TI04_10260 [Achromatium sp. WMS2]|nr:hypothetical protein TI04_10260 [Achromatium sp. WMS2]